MHPMKKKLKSNVSLSISSTIFYPYVIASFIMNFIVIYIILLSRTTGAIHRSQDIMWILELQVYVSVIVIAGVIYCIAIVQPLLSLPLYQLLFKDVPGYFVSYLLILCIKPIFRSVIL